MIELIIPAIVIIIITVFFMFFVFKSVVNKLNNNTKKYFIDKLQNYDDVINLKKQEIQDLDKQIKNMQVQREKIAEETPNILTDFKSQIRNNEKEKKVKEKKEKEQKEEEEAIISIPNPQFREEAFFNTYRFLRQQFKIDDEKVIKEFLKEHTNNKEQKEYETLIKFRNYFDSDTIYQCLTLTKEEQFEVINSATKKRQKKLLGLENYSKENFDLMKFLEKLDSKIEQVDPIVYVYVGNKELNYDYLSTYVKTCIYEKMIEGIIISYQGKIYDYSI